MIIPVYKPLGSSTHQLAKKAGELHNEKATHTGTLDPMAEGVVIVLTGEERFDKEKYSQYKKTYQFQMLMGVSTDSYDLLGLTTSLPIDRDIRLGELQLEHHLQQILPQFIGQQEQIVPAFSAKRLQGKSYFDAAKKGKTVPKVSEIIEIFDLKLSNLITINTQSLLPMITDKISTVTGDFRQEQIIRNWRDYLENTQQKNYYLASLTGVTSKRTYIRGLVSDLGKATGIDATTYSITRAANGPYTIADCICLL